MSNVATLVDLGTKVVNRGSCCEGMADFLDLQVAPHDGHAWGTLAEACTIPECLDDRMGANNLPSGMGYAIEQVGGPALFGP